MQYLVLIYEDESRFANGYPEAEFAEYGAFGKKHASAIKGGNALQPTATAKTVRVRDTKVAYHRWSFRGDQGAARRLLPDRSGEHRRSSLDCIRHPGCPLRQHRSPAHHGLLIALRTTPESAPAFPDSTLNLGSKEAP